VEKHAAHSGALFNTRLWLLANRQLIGLHGARGNGTLVDDGLTIGSHRGATGFRAVAANGNEDCESRNSGQGNDWEIFRH
jgi:hypothetical protein